MWEPVPGTAGNSRNRWRRHEALVLNHLVPLGSSTASTSPRVASSFRRRNTSSFRRRSTAPPPPGCRPPTASAAACLSRIQRHTPDASRLPCTRLPGLPRNRFCRLRGCWPRRYVADVSGAVIIESFSAGIPGAPAWLIPWQSGALRCRCARIPECFPRRVPPCGGGNLQCNLTIETTQYATCERT